MDIKRLNHFIALAEEGRFAQAANRVHLSQAAFSRSIQALEERMGLRLFDRGAKGARITPAGEVVLQRARNLLFDSRCLQRDIELVKRGDAGEIVIGAAPIPASVLIPDMLCQLRQKCPQLVTRVRMGNLAKLLEQLDTQEIDFCLGDPRLMVKNSRYDMISVGKQSGGLYCRRGHPLVREGTATPAQLSSHGVALISITPELLEGISLACGYSAADEFPRVVECDDMGTLVHLAGHTDVIGLLPHAVAERATLVPLKLPSGHAHTLFADVHAIWLKGRTRSPAAIQAIDLARKLGKQKPGK